MNTNETQTRSTMHAMLQRIYEKKRLFYIVIPCCFVASYLLLLTVPAKYACSVQIASERQEARNHNRAMILNQAADYDIGMVPTENAIKIYGLEVMATSPQVTSALFNIPVQTADGQWQGTLSDYYTQYIGKWGKALNPVSAPEKNSIGATREQDRLRQRIKRSIKTKIDANSDILTIEVKTQDPKVSAMVAQAILDELANQVEAYQMQKMESTLTQMEHIAQEAEDAYTNTGNQAEDKKFRREVFESFRRQQVMYAAQMMKQASFVTLVAPMTEYKVVGPHRKIDAFIITVLVTLGLGLIVCRKEILASL